MVILPLILSKYVCVPPRRLSHPPWQLTQVPRLREKHTNREEEGVEAHMPSSRDFSKDPGDNGRDAN